MPRNVRTASIPSAYSSPSDNQGKIPLLFQVLSPDFETPLLPEAMFLHVNPSSLDMGYAKSVARFQTLGGWQEQHFGEELSDISADQTSGAFVNVDTGLTVLNRRDTIAYRKFVHLKELFHNNGAIHNDRGAIVFRGRIRLVFEGGIYDGHFQNISFSEAADTPFSFSANWSFKVEKESRNLII